MAINKNSEIYLYNPTYLVGDVHGKFHDLHSILKKLNNCNVIVLGDCGLFRESDFIRLNRIVVDTLLYQNIKLLLLRGNHDNPAIWNRMVISTPPIQFLQDGYIIHQYIKKSDNIIVKTGYVISGGISIDRTFRQTGESYWPNEVIDYEFHEENIIAEMKHSREGKIDFFLSHVGPVPFSLQSGSKIFNHFMEIDKTLAEDIKKEKFFCECYAQATKAWYYGHYHVHETGMKLWGCDCRALDILEVVELK